MICTLSLNGVELLCEVDVMEEDCSPDAAEGEVLLVLVQELVQVRPLGEEPPAALEGVKKITSTG